MLLLLLSHFSCVWLFATLWTVASQSPLSMGFSKQEYWSGLPYSPPGNLPNPGIRPRSPALQADSLPLSHQGSPVAIHNDYQIEWGLISGAHVLITEKAMALHSSTLAWKIPRMEEPGRLQSMGVAKSQTWLSDFTFTIHFHTMEKEMATHSSVLDWRTPGTGEPGGLPSMGSHRVGHNWSDLAAAACSYKWSPGEGNDNPTPVFLPGKSHGQRSLTGYSSQ